MLINFIQYFQIEAAAKGNVPYLLGLDLLLANEGLRRQETEQQERARAGNLEFEKTVETAYLEQKTEKRDQEIV